MTAVQRSHARTAYKLNRYKLRAGCCLCGWREFPEGLDCHHPGKKNWNVDPTKHGWSKIVLELRLCVVLCSLCHKGLHAGRRFLPGREKKLEISKKHRPNP
jgi:hypothetical protein